MNKDLLLILIKNPVLGKAKTRLAATVGPEKALAVYQMLLERTRRITTGLTCDKALFYSDFVDKQDAWDNDVYRKYVQQGQDLGERMLQAFATGFNLGYRHICIIGSDCYELTSDLLEDAFAQLEKQEVVVGPSTDGGYYLLGMNNLQPALFQNKDWSTAEVLAQTIADVEKEGLSLYMLPALTDVDEEKDLRTIPELSLM